MSNLKNIDMSNLKILLNDIYFLKNDEAIIDTLKIILNDEFISEKVDANTKSQIQDKINTVSSPATDKITNTSLDIVKEIVDIIPYNIIQTQPEFMTFLKKHQIDTIEKKNKERIQKIRETEANIQSRTQRIQEKKIEAQRVREEKIIRDREDKLIKDREDKLKIESDKLEKQKTLAEMISKFILSETNAVVNVKIQSVENENGQKNDIDKLIISVDNFQINNTEIPDDLIQNAILELVNSESELKINQDKLLFQQKNSEDLNKLLNENPKGERKGGKDNLKKKEGNTKTRKNRTDRFIN
jgi:hypothetical protein